MLLVASMYHLLLSILVLNIAKFLAVDILLLSKVAKYCGAFGLVFCNLNTIRTSYTQRTHGRRFLLDFYRYTLFLIFEITLHCCGFFFVLDSFRVISLSSFLLL